MFCHLVAEDSRVLEVCVVLQRIPRNSQWDHWKGDPRETPPQPLVYSGNGESLCRKCATAKVCAEMENEM